VRIPIAFFLLAFFISSCNAQQDSAALVNGGEVTHVFPYPTEQPNQLYVNVKQEANTKRAKWLAQYNLLSQDKKQTYLTQLGDSFTNLLLGSIVPYWYGTDWDFNGYTDIPNEGSVACGYFVSTTLKHVGLNINRYKMAQQGGMNEAKTLDLGQKMIKSYNRNKYTLNEIIDALPRGLYFVGMDFHVGFVFKDTTKAWFIHSDYYNDKVVVEQADLSANFTHNKVYVFEPISANTALMRKWLLGEWLEVVH
jgi:hypothetical protein